MKKTKQTMKKVFIKYNPYKLETEITVGGEPPKGNSKLKEKAAPGNRLQEWVDELPYILADEYNDRSFDIVFHGTLPDYEDLDEALSEAYENKTLEQVKLERKPAKETADKEKLIDEVFREIQKGPFDELQSKEIENAFKHAKSSDFEVCVVATMSAGKSTLINSMLQKKLMPSKQEACTAIITRIKDNDQASWKAKVYNRDGHLLETQEELTYKTMGRLNEDEKVSEIRVEGNIPFVTAEDVSLVLIDTPGPNNSRDPGHARVQSEFLGKSSKSLVLYIMEGTFGSNDDNALLKQVAASMSVGGKQSKDRFIFVVNKMDNKRGEDDGNTEQLLDRIREYLKKQGIENPNLFPAAALPALDIRRIQSGSDEINDDLLDETDYKVRKFNRKSNTDLQFEKYASLPKGLKEDIEDQLREAEEKEDEYSQALIHTGIVSIEAAIRQYVQKYAKTAKIKNIVDTFKHKVEEVGCFEETKKELAERQGKNEEIIRQINAIQKKIDDGNEAKTFKKIVKDAVKETADKSVDAIDEKVGEFKKEVNEKIVKFKEKELPVEEAKEEIEDIIKFTDKLKPDLEAELKEIVEDNLISTGKALLKEYKQKLLSLNEDLRPTSEIPIEPVKLMGGSIVSSEAFSIENFVKENQEDIKEWVPNLKWYKPWTWWWKSPWYQDDGYYKTIGKGIPGNEVINKVLQPTMEGIDALGDNAIEHIEEQSKEIEETFSSEFKKLDGKLNEKLKELKSYAEDGKEAEKRVRESEKKLEWLKKINKKIEEILEI